MHARAITAQRHESDDCSWAFARCRPHQALRGDVVGYTGYVEHAVVSVRRREVPAPRVPVIISFGDTIEVVGGGAGFGPERSLRSFVAGFSDSYALTEYVGRQRGVQIDLTPFGAYRLLGMTGADIGGGLIDLESVLGRSADGMVDRLLSAPGWPARFDLIDTVLLSLRRQAPPVDPAVDWVWGRLVQTRGGAAVGALADDVGWSRRHLSHRFRRHVGLGPKAAGRVIRFDRAARLLGDGRTISEVAAETGFADHSHLVREFRAMAGCTPSALLAERAADG